MASASFRAVAPSSANTPAFCAADLSFPCSSKSLPVAMRLPSTSRKVAENSVPSASGVSHATKSQYSAEVKLILSRSRSTTIRVATDCTRPADKPVRILRHSRGETSYPTRRSRIRRVSWALTRSVSSSRGWFRAWLIASLVIS